MPSSSPCPQLAGVIGKRTAVGIKENSRELNSYESGVGGFLLCKTYLLIVFNVHGKYCEISLPSKCAIERHVVMNCCFFYIMRSHSNIEQSENKKEKECPFVEMARQYEFR